IGALFLVLFLAATSIQGNVNSGKSLSITQDELFNMRKVWEVHLQFADSNFQAMWPYGGRYGLSPEDSGFLDFSAILAPLFIQMGDKNSDHSLDRKEFNKLYNNWFATWDTLGKDSLTRSMIDIGYNAMNDAFDLRSRGYLRNGVAGLLGIYAPSVLGDVSIANETFADVVIRYKGNGTLFNVNNRKKSIKIDLNDLNPSLDLAGVTKINMHNLITDAGYMNDALAYEMFREGGVPGPQTSYAKVYISTDSLYDEEYFGLYLLVENVDNNFAFNRFGSKKGVLFKPVTPHLFEYLGDDWKNYIRTFDPKTPIFNREANRIIEICKFVSQASDEEFESQFTRYFNLDNLARYMAINTIICDLDGILGPGQNMYLYLHPKTFQLHFIPWDHDHSFGQMRGTQEERERLDIDEPWMFSNPFLERVYKLETFKEKYHQYLYEFNNTLFTPDRILTRIAELAEVIRPAIQEESEEHLKNFDLTVGWGLNEKNTDKYDTVLNKEGAKPLRLFVEKRYQSVNQQLAGEEEGLAASGGVLPKGMMGNILITSLDDNKDTYVTYEEFNAFFDNLFKGYAGEDSIMQYAEIRKAINLKISPAGIHRPETHIAVPEPRDKIYLSKN
ncbi:MAG: CotH kinase family protein, partial [Fulvivirga sp.]|nr:CotH kinase family protein [Fulvivirga sp.]